MSEIYNRLKKIREAKKMSQAKFAKMLGIGQSTLGMMEVGKREILDRHIKTICSICNINEEWFRTGNGEMTTCKDSFSLDEYARQKGMSPLELETIKNFMDFSLEQREQILDFLKKIYPKNPNMDKKMK